MKTTLKIVGILVAAFALTGFVMNHLPEGKTVATSQDEMQEVVSDPVAEETQKTEKEIRALNNTVVFKGIKPVFALKEAEETENQ
ncbi:hypothetical protein COB55_01510 [Candidatus Wolfebacteria bacterium]|nr:MAG: hypothetical protein COB55_01510 [Candidatus Wolfebacteria bacterium]